MLRCYEPAHIAGVSKIAYVPATPRCLQWRRGPPRTSTNGDPAGSAGRRSRVAGLLVVIAAIAAALGSHSLVSSPASVAVRPVDRSRSEQRDALGEADGAVPDGTTVFDDEVPGVANLDPALLGALRQAATHAAADGVEFVVDSGWRSPEYQEQLLPRGGLEVRLGRGSCAMGGHPRHVCSRVGRRRRHRAPRRRGVAVQHGAEYGLCRIYGNEPWHFELLPEASDHGCPAMYADPTHDPRMQP